MPLASKAVPIFVGPGLAPRMLHTYQPWTAGTVRRRLTQATGGVPVP
jgi:hypothetical protein